MQIRTLLCTIIFCLFGVSCNEIVDYTSPEITFACKINECGVPCSQRVKTGVLFCEQHRADRDWCLFYLSGSGGGSTNDIFIYEGRSYLTVAYTVRGNTIYHGRSYDVAYTIRGNEIYESSSFLTVAYNVQRNIVYRGRSSIDVAYTIRGNEVYEGSSYLTVAYTIRRN